MVMSNNNVLDVAPSSMEELLKANNVTAEYLLDIGKRVEEARLSPQEGIDLINERLLIIDKQITMSGGKAFIPLRHLCIEVREIVSRHMS